MSSEPLLGVMDAGVLVAAEFGGDAKDVPVIIVVLKLCGRHGGPVEQHAFPCPRGERPWSRLPSSWGSTVPQLAFIAFIAFMAAIAPTRKKC
jgi:hypothetical protein